MSNVNYPHNGAINHWTRTILSILQDRRKEKRIKLKDVAAQLDVVPSTATRLESGDMEMTMPYFLLFCVAIKEDPFQLLQESWYAAFGGKIDGGRMSANLFFQQAFSNEQDPMALLDEALDD